MGWLGADGVWGAVKASFDVGWMVREKQRRAVRRPPWGRSVLEHSEEQQANQDRWRVANERGTTRQRPKGQARQMKKLAVL